MNRRDFIKKSAVAAAATAVVAPVSAMLPKTESTGLATEEAEPEMTIRPLKASVRTLMERIPYPENALDVNGSWERIQKSSKTTKEEPDSLTAVGSHTGYSKWYIILSSKEAERLLSGALLPIGEPKVKLKPCQRTCFAVFL